MSKDDEPPPGTVAITYLDDYGREQTGYIEADLLEAFESGDDARYEAIMAERHPDAPLASKLMN